MRGREFAMFADRLKEKQPEVKDSMSAWLQYKEDVEAVADVLQQLYPQEFRRQQFYYKCLNNIGVNGYGKTSASSIFQHQRV